MLAVTSESLHPGTIFIKLVETKFHLMSYNLGSSRKLCFGLRLICLFIKVVQIYQIWSQTYDRFTFVSNNLEKISSIILT